MATTTGLISYEYYKHTSGSKTYYYYKNTFQIVAVLGTVIEFDEYVQVPVTVSINRTARANAGTSKQGNTKTSTTITPTIYSSATATIPQQTMPLGGMSVTIRAITATALGTFNFRIPRPTGDNPETVTISLDGTYMSLSMGSSSATGSYGLNIGSISINPYVPPTPTGTKLSVKVNGTWIEGEPKVKTNGTWIDANTLFIKENGTWIQVN